MLTLNLVDKNTSDIPFEVSHFPDGQQQVNLIIKSSLKEIGMITPVTIKARLNNFTDLELIICAVRSLRNLRFRHINLYVPYFLGSRSDRQFAEGSNNYIKEVIAPIINNLKLDSVTVMDPHSDVLEACLNNFHKLSNVDLVKFFMEDIRFSQEIVLVSPDAGASKKIFKIAEEIDCKADILICSKYRDEHGKLSKTMVPTSTNNIDKDFVIIDDICDGGATFINIAKAIREDKNFNDSKIYLIVTHGIFSKGLEELKQYFENIYCTNSYKDFIGVEDGFVKQLNVF